MKPNLWPLLLLLMVTPVAAPAGVSVTRTTLPGRQAAWRLSNGTVDVVIVPGLGRILAFQFTGHPETSPLFTNPDALVHPVPLTPGKYPTDWANYGGDKLWPSEQSDWARHQPKSWPPDPSIEQGPYTVTRLRDGVCLTGPLSPYYQIRVVREITLPPHGARVDIRDTFLKSPDATGPRDGFLVGIWNISQVRGDATAYLPLNPHGLFPDVGLTSLDSDPRLMPNWNRAGDTVAVTRPSNIGTKMGVDDSAGWIACVFGGDLLFAEHFTRDPHGLYPDRGCSAELYTNGDDRMPYMEMEVLGRMTHLRAGQALTLTLSWTLQRLPSRPAGDADARRLVTAAMAAPR